MTTELTRDALTRFPSNGPTDPIRYYTRPMTGWMFRERINLGLRMLRGRRFERALEVGYGAGAVQMALHGVANECHGIDLDADPALAMNVLASMGLRSELRAGSVYDLPYGDAEFDLVASFSTFEHLDRYDRALDEVCRVLKRDGCFLLGMPAVNRMMEAGFLAIGFKGINDHHVTTPAQVADRFAAHGLKVLRHARLTLPIPGGLGVPVYYDWLLERR